MVNLVITLRHTLKYRGGRVVQRGDELPETGGASWTVRNRVVKMSKGEGRIEMGKDEKAWRKSVIGFDGRITKNHAKVGR